MNKLMKFFIICAITFVVGLGLCLGGVFSGGVDGINKVAEDHDWLDGSPGKMQIETLSNQDFESVEVTGQVEMVFVGAEFMTTDSDWHLPDSLASTIKEDIPEEGTVLICHGENVAAPEYNIEDGVLKIEGGAPDDGVVSMNFSSDDGVPKVVVFCGDRMLKNITTSNNWCDVVMLGIAFENASISGSDNDVFMEAVQSENLKIDGNCTDVQLHGAFHGTVDVTTNDADVIIETSVNRDKYAVDIDAEYGDIELDNGEIEIDGYPWKYSCEGGPNKIIVKNSCGDVEVFYGDTLYQ
ncbi:MAG: DUF4097 family beta strand repeat-containing protein [Bacillota bacterium]|nr:DUF4097 family beta strand repeat-containing protein [Bacillota bacterium]